MKGQTATEYIILIAVVIVIAIIVVVSLSKTAPVSEGTADLIGKAQLRTERVSTVNFAVNSNTTTLILENTRGSQIIITAILLDNTNCTSAQLPARIPGGSQTAVVCQNINTTTNSFSFDYQINYTRTGAQYTLDLPNLEGNTAQG